ncbi:sigma-70 family RNA polymerase sigma factor [Actinocorallia sp. A-T 12471]|uniref:RNA polymerase sigma factor n=1 Tax=Actinocorallia sp. A-T 12471 TaxID=3089813 RepID=UPI0029D3BF14|nr:sigma-70 family RNA polymerase sigma factor [Actinocorallia sp. A-T 12471]MDX6738154.1 sigma-70 family RNA polymerase sigma factor [Actinocorallia sp. A-T 12471]
MNVVRNHRRSSRRYRDVLERMPHVVVGEDDAEAVAGRGEDERRMREVLARIAGLARRYQDVLALCVWEELSYADGVAALGIHVGTVRSRLNRARERVREAVPAPGYREGEHSLREELL